jgi:hypothetical protein
MAYHKYMVGFLVKKTFFDLWDNLFKAALLNLGFILSAAAPVFALSRLESLPLAALLVLFAGILWCFVYLFAAARSLRAVSDYGSFGFADFFAGLRAAWPGGLVMGFLVFLMWLLAAVAIPFYLGMNSILGLFLAALIFWTLAAGVLALQFFPAVYSRLDSKITKAVRKCFLIFFDNPGFCVFSFFYNLAALAVSVFLAFLFPGPAGLLLYWDEALRLRLLKYDWLEANPGANRRRIPWDALLIEEREKTGTRSFKNFIFPWKD